MKMRHSRGVALAVLVFACGAVQAAPPSKDEYKAARKKIEADYQAERQKCGVRHGNALDLCVARAHGLRDVAKAELEAGYKPSPRTDYYAAMARAKSASNVAKQECDERKRGERKACLKDAEAALARAQAEARAKREAETAAEKGGKPAAR
jgi:hypothetical protein